MIWNPVMDGERMKPGHWLGLVLCVSFGALTLMVGDRKDIQSVETMFY